MLRKKGKPCRLKWFFCRRLYEKISRDRKLNTEKLRLLYPEDIPYRNVQAKD